LVGSIVAIVFCAGLLFLAGTIVWFGVKGARNRKGRQEALHQPEIAGIESKWQVKLPSSLEAYFQSPIVDRSEFYLAPPGSAQSEWLYIEQFLPLTVRSLSRWIPITNVPGIPIALDGAKGTYYLPFAALREGTSLLMLRLPGSKREDRKIAHSFEEFVTYEARDVPAER
jgi:hypothetical protein